MVVIKVSDDPDAFAILTGTDIVTNRFKIKGSIGELVLAILAILVAIMIPLSEPFWLIFRAVLVLGIIGYVVVILTVMVRRRRRGPVA